MPNQKKLLDLKMRILNTFRIKEKNYFSSLLKSKQKKEQKEIFVRMKKRLFRFFPEHDELRATYSPIMSNLEQRRVKTTL